MVAAEA